MLTTDKGKDVNLNVFDTAGQEKYRTITSSFYTNCKGVMVMFDLSDAASFDALENWFNESSRYAEKATQFLIGNKSDVSERTVTPERIQQVVSKYGVTYFETSAATGAGVFEAFKAIAQQLVDDEDDLLGGEAPPTD
jgi:small GTP-binding protein